MDRGILVRVSLEQNTFATGALQIVVEQFFAY